MSLRFRKSIKIAKGVRVNVGKSGVSLSFGTRGLRYSIHSSGRRTSTVGLPSTGLSYSKSSKSGSKRRSTSPSVVARQQQKLDDIQENTIAVEEFNHLLEYITSVHKECDEFVDWNKIYSVPAPFNPPKAGPNKTKAIREYEGFTPSFLERLFKTTEEKRRAQLKRAIAEAELLDVQEYEEWKSLHQLANQILQGDIDSYFQVIDEMNPLDDLLEFGSNFEISAYDGSILEVEFRVKSDIVVPKEVLSLTKTGKISRKPMTKTHYYELIQDYVSSCSIRIARDMVALLPADQVAVHAVEEVLNTATGFHEEVTVLSVLFDRNGLDKINFELIDPSDALQNFRCHMKHMKTSGFKPVERIVKF